MFIVINGNRSRCEGAVMVLYEAAIFPITDITSFEYVEQRKRIEKAIHILKSAGLY